MKQFVKIVAAVISVIGSVVGVWWCIAANPDWFGEEFYELMARIVPFVMFAFGCVLGWCIHDEINNRRKVSVKMLKGLSGDAKRILAELYQAQGSRECSDGEESAHELLAECKLAIMAIPDRGVFGGSLWYIEPTVRTLIHENGRLRKALDDFKL